MKKFLIIICVLIIPFTMFSDDGGEYEVELGKKGSGYSNRVPGLTIRCICLEDEVIFDYPDEWGMIYVTLTNTANSRVQTFEAYSGIPVIAKLSGTMIIDVITCDGREYYGFINISNPQ